MLNEKDIRLIEHMITEAVTSAIRKEKDYRIDDVVVTQDGTTQEEMAARVDTYKEVFGKRDGEKRKAKVIFALSGGKASKGSQTTRITLPITWVREMGITPQEREVEIQFKDGKIVIEKAKQSPEV